MRVYIKAEQTVGMMLILILSVVPEQVGPQVLGYGSQGTMVFEGSLHGRSVAVKRMLRHLYHLAKKEIDALILSDEVGPSCCCSANL